MRIKEVLRTSNLSWSPGQVHPLYIAAGTSAKQLDASFSSSSSLEILEVDTSSKGWDMPVRGCLDVASRFNVIEWGSVEKEMGLIAGGGDNGVISLWDPAKIISNEESALECELPKHCGPVRSMDFNPAKKCLLASGASGSEIHIVDINSPSVLMTPGPKAQPEDDVVDLAWNKQVEHILASAHPNSARSIVWDLRKNEAIIQVTDASNRLRCSCIAWHPDIATQLLTCSDEDRYPVIQMWDLRFANAPTMVFEGHARGIQTLAWCGQDSSMLLSCSRDDHVICWNPNNSSVPGGEKLVEFTAPSQWTFDMGWCARNPYLVASSAFSGKLSVFSLFGGQEDIPEQPQRTRVSSDPFAPGPPPPSLPMNIPPLNKAPKWLMKPCGVSFGFGGKLISFDSTSTQITVMQVSTECELLERSEKLEQALQENTLLQFCGEKAEASESSNDKQIWSFLKSTFDGKPRQRYLELLGYRAEDIPEMVSNLSDSVGELTLDSDTAIINKSDADSSSSEKGSDKGSESGDTAKVEKPLVIDTSAGVDGLICRAMLLGQFEVVVDLCLKAGRMADALAVAMAGGRELFHKTQQEYFRQATSPSAALLSCIISQRWSNLVETVELSNWKEALAILLSYAKPTEFNGLCDTLAGRLSADPGFSLEATLCYICSGNVAELLECWQNENNEESNSPLQLQELIEKVMCLQSTNSTNRPLEGDKVVANLLKYSQLLAEQGKLSNALTYISATPAEAAAEFKYQLHMALNDPSLPRPPIPYSRTRLPSAASSLTPNSPAPSTYTGYNSSAYAPPRSYAPSVAPSSVSSYAPTASLVSGTSTYTPPSKVAYQAPAYTAPEPPAPATQPGFNPPGPPSTFQPPPTSTFQPPTSTFQPPPTSTFQPPPTSTFQPPPTSTFQPPPPPTSTFQPPTYQPPPTSTYQPPPTSTYQPPPTSTFQPPSTSYPQPPGSNFSGLGSMAGSSVSTYTPYIPPAEPSPPPKPVSRPKGAWNDPPMLKKKIVSAPPVQTQKITTPVVGPIKTVDLNPDPGQGTQPGFQQPYNPNAYSAAPPEPEPAPAPVEKPPVPEHYISMLTSLESAANSCKAATQNPTHRRKLEEVSVKLEALKDRLRYDSVSGAVVESLNGIANAISVNDYNQALHIHSYVAQTANFSEVGSFLPGIKVLLQIGAQMHTVHHY